MSRPTSATGPRDGSTASSRPRPSPTSPRQLVVAGCPSQITVHFASLAPEDVTVIDGIPVTSVFRTLLDLAPYLT